MLLLLKIVVSPWRILPVVELLEEVDPSTLLKMLPTVFCALTWPKLISMARAMAPLNTNFLILIVLLLTFFLRAAKLHLFL